jgi:uncharacterized protein YjbJ (UPF0337 family)
MYVRQEICLGVFNADSTLAGGRTPAGTRLQGQRRLGGVHRNSPSAKLAARLRAVRRPYRLAENGGYFMGNEQQNEGKLEQARGTIKENVGKAIDNEQMEYEGKLDQGKGNVREGVGDVREDWDKNR